ncbi:signal peptidase I [Cohnella fermenti]|uniref:Signal peptidase I n=1 Tax=Cohnella fermenti TaxID=2565925 RepID=A0A4S4BEX5_9BACL|nr:signal peptidase I [Cohnella fermenti]THF72651.1 signal peptidase I [Cohnella fermenti]
MSEAPGTVPSGRRRSARADRPAWRKELWDWLRALVVAFVIVVLLRAFVFQLSTVKSISMQPTLYEKQWLFVNKLSYEIGHPSRGDVIILKDPSEGEDPKTLLVKRIVGMPGDQLEVRNRQLYVNGVLQIEPYTDAVIEDGDIASFTVSEGHYFVMGDNRHLESSKDSRSFGEVPESFIKGRADMIIWPISRIGRL